MFDHQLGQLFAVDELRDAMVRFFMSLPLAFQAKTPRPFKITKVPCFAGFLSTGLFGVAMGDAQKHEEEFGLHDWQTSGMAMNIHRAGLAKAPTG